MIRFNHFHVSQRHTSAAVMAELTELYPEGLVSPGIAFRMVSVPDGDARLDHAKAIFDRHGIAPVEPFGESGPNTYRYSTSVIYEPQDLEDADYFCFDTEYDGVETTYCEVGEDFKVYAHELQKRTHRRRLFLDNGYANTMMVPDRVRQRLEAHDFKGLCFKPLQACNRKETTVSWDKVEYGPYWWMTSDIMLPRLHPDINARDGNGRPWNEATSRTGAYLVEDKFPIGQLRYRASDLLPIGDFDVAVTCETFGISKHTESREVIVSPRMGEVMHDMEKKIYWKPVYVDADA